MDPPFTAFGTTARDEFARHRTAVGKRAREAAMRRALNSRARVVGTGRRDRQYVGRRTRASALRRRTLTGGARGGGGGGGVGGRCVDDAANAFDADSQLAALRAATTARALPRKAPRRGGGSPRVCAPRRPLRYTSTVHHENSNAARPRRTRSPQPSSPFSRRPRCPSRRRGGGARVLCHRRR